MVARIRSLSVVLFLIFNCMLVSSVHAHADLIGAIPAADSTLTAAPTAVRLVFSEELAATGNLITVVDASGNSVDQNDTQVVMSDPQRQTLEVSLKSGLVAGNYTVRWKNTSSDGHSVEGEFRFSIATAPATPVPATLPNTGTSDRSSVANWLGLGALLTIVGFLIRRRVMRKP